MNEVIETPIAVYIRLDGAKIVDINSQYFIDDISDWIKIDEGYGDKYTHAQGHYLTKSLMDENGQFNYKYEDGKIVEVADEDKPKVLQYTYSQLVEIKIRQRYTVSDELAILRQRDTKPQEFAEYNDYCEQCKVEARKELNIQ
jgi:hypothetical protein